MTLNTWRSLDADLDRIGLSGDDFDGKGMPSDGGDVDKDVVGSCEGLEVVG